MRYQSNSALLRQYRNSVCRLNVGFVQEHLSLGEYLHVMTFLYVNGMSFIK